MNISQPTCIFDFGFSAVVVVATCITTQWSNDVGQRHCMYRRIVYTDIIFYTVWTDDF
ncbi:hypothetical protein [uncultured Methanobrevibacter sp.]|uniref:hypothetical protein n=1 Tax=uncultured Methanobrevibacter sp. TaxID=253161 RepID=UPI0025FD2A8B|nr:hypothetical protein [uncultured Methanobrevibacter sp.]